ncbi:MAG: hypothetical protein WC584_03510 [Candidatus Pacearchaeota archaeon]
MEEITKINYTFNYDGRTERSFDNAYKGLIKVLLEDYNSQIHLEIEFSMRTALSEEQRTKIDKTLVEYKREPIFQKE